MFISRHTLNEILRVIGTHPIESGGIIGCVNNTICAFAFDSNYTSTFEYIPNVQHLNDVIGKWNSQGISFCGLVHSHLFGFNYPSKSDREYAQLLYETNSCVRKMYFPIVTINDNNSIQIDFYQYAVDKKDFIKLQMCQNKLQANRYLLKEM